MGEREATPAVRCRELRLCSSFLYKGNERVVFEINADAAIAAGYNQDINLRRVLEREIRMNDNSLVGLNSGHGRRDREDVHFVARMFVDIQWRDEFGNEHIIKDEHTDVLGSSFQRQGNLVIGAGGIASARCASPASEKRGEN